MSQPLEVAPPPTPATSAPSHQNYLDRTYFPELDGLRALSVLIVVSVHMKDAIWKWLAGHLGVTIFFVLSGYLITRLALREERDVGRLVKRAFFVRRVFRLFPAYYAVLFLYVALIMGLGISPEKRGQLLGALPYYLTYWQEWPFFLGVNGSVQNVPFYQTWTLGIEEKFYFVWPLIGFVIWRGRPAVRRWGTAALVGLTALAPILCGDKVGQFIYPYAQILIGCLVALLLDAPPLYDAIRRRLARPAALWTVILLLLALHFATPHVPDPFARAHQFVYAVVAGLALVAIILDEGPLRRGLRARPLVAIGRLSYGIYLVHLLALNVAEKVARPGTGNVLVAFSALVLTWIIATGAAAVLAATIERPGIVVGRRLSARLIGRARSRPV